jgi:hypothetical protein
MENCSIISGDIDTPAISKSCVYRMIVQGSVRSVTHKKLKAVIELVLHFRRKLFEFLLELSMKNNLHAVNA